MLTTIVLSIALAKATPLQLKEDNIPEIVSAMTVEEKCALLVGGEAAKAFDGIGLSEHGVKGAAGVVTGIPRLGIPQIVLADGPAGLRIDPSREGDPRTFYCTGFPIATMLSLTWNPSLVYEVGAAIGNEVLEYGGDVLLAPAISPGYLPTRLSIIPDIERFPAIPITQSRISTTRNIRRGSTSATGISVLSTGAASCILSATASATPDSAGRK